MPTQAQNQQLWHQGKNARFGTSLLTDPVSYYGPRRSLLDGASQLPQTNLWGWWDFTALGLGNGDAVTSADDLGPYANDMTNSGAVTYVTGIQNGLGGVDVDNGRYLDNGTVADGWGDDTVFSVLGIAKREVDGSCGVWSDGGGSPSGALTTTNMQGVGGTTLRVSLGAADDTDAHMFIWVSNGASSKLYIDAETAVTTGTWTPAAAPAASFRTGTGASGDTHICELAVWTHALDTTEIAAIATYVENKYALTIGA